MNLKEIVTKLAPQIIACRRDFHKYPEVGWTEFRTASIIYKKLKTLGYDITMGDKAMVKTSRMGVPSEDELKKHQQRAIEQGADPEIVEMMAGGMTGMWADMTFSNDGPFVAFRFDMDALPVTENNSESHFPAVNGFASVNPGVMHACGHDGHSAIGLGVAEIIAGMKDRLKGRIRLIFQPAEEGVRGAKPMLDAGAVDGVEYFMGTHIGLAESGTFTCGTEEFLASTKSSITFNGKGAHAGVAPHNGKNAIMACCCATLNIQAISRHGDGPTRINVGKIIAGEGRNMIAPHAYMEIETRGATSELDEYMMENVERIVKAAADMYDCTYHIDIVGCAKTAICDDAMLDLVADVAKEVDFYTHIARAQKVGGTDDVTYFMNKVQQNGGIATYALLGTNLDGPAHNASFNFDENDLIAGVELYARMALRLMGHA